MPFLFGFFSLTDLKRAMTPGTGGYCSMSKAKRKNKKLPAECTQCRAIHQAYLEFSLNEDEKLGLIAALLMGQSREYDIDTATIIEIGYTIDSYLQHKLVRESVFFGRTLNRCKLPESELKAEIQRVRAFRKGL
jgi:hypothetical protein